MGDPQNKDNILNNPIVMFILLVSFGCLGVTGMVTGRVLGPHHIYKGWDRELEWHASRNGDPVLYWINELLYTGLAISLLLRLIGSANLYKSKQDDDRDNLDVKIERLGNLYPDMKAKIQNIKERVFSVGSSIAINSFSKLVDIMISQTDPEKVRKSIENFETSLNKFSK